jgi:ATP-dependent DNA ligase
VSEQFDIPAGKMLAAVREQQLEGAIGKRKDSVYEAGKRSGAWVKMRVNKGQEFVIGGFTPGPQGVIRSSLATTKAKICTTSLDCEMDLCLQLAGWSTKS